MVSYSTQNYSSLKKSTWPHLLLVGQLGQTGSNLFKTCIIWCGSLQMNNVSYTEKFCYNISIIDLNEKQKIKNLKIK